MHLGIFAASHKPEESALIKALGAAPGVKITMLAKRTGEFSADCDMHCIIGVKHAKLMKALEAKGLPYLYWDKAYNRHWPRWWRMSYCSHQPTRYLMLREFGRLRARAQGWLNFRPWRANGEGPILFAGASAKYHVYHGLLEPDAYAAQVLREVRCVSQREFVYRPKPSYRAACPIEGAGFSHVRAFAPDLESARVLVTHGSSACLDALLEGLPSVVLGDGVTRGISSTRIDDVEAPRLACVEDRRQMLAALGYFQWSLAEIAQGEHWPVIDWVRRCT
jgi:hypothetical protein